MVAFNDFSTSFIFRSESFIVSLDSLDPAVLKMVVFNGKMYSSCYCETLSTLEEFLPSIFVSKCFNDRNQCFKKEVKNTEIGHLYEHIVLEYISDYIELKINTRPNVSGFTCWDWNDKNEGVFEITINTANFEALSFAISKATSLLERIIKTSVAPKQMTLEATCLVSSVV